MDDKKTGTVYLIGAGPGDPDLITVKGKELLSRCDVVLYDKLIPEELVISLPEGVEKIYVGKDAGWHSVPQAEIQERMVNLAREGKNVARLKGGDPFLFGRGGEEADYLRQRGIPYEVVPGLTAGLAAPLYTGIACTDRRKAPFVLLVTGHRAKDKESGAPWEWIAQARQGTVVVYMGVAEMENIAANLMSSGMPPETPAAVIERGTFSTQRVIAADLGGIAAKIKSDGVRPPALLIIGETVASRADWLLSKPLYGVRIMVTRPADQAQEMYRTLRELGAEVLAYPTITTAELDAPEIWQRFRGISADRRWLVFTSENGVRYFFRQFARYAGDIRGLGLFKIAAVGYGTAEALNKFHLTADFVPTKATVASLASEMREKLDLEGAAVVRVAGDLADDTVKNALEQVGAQILTMTVYRTFHPTWPDGMKTRLFEHPPHAIMFTSGSTVDGLFAVLSPEEAQKLTQNAALASIGPSTSKVLAARGLTPAVEAREHNIPSLIRDLTEYFARR